MNSTVVEKIKKLLSLAQSDNPHERDAAMSKATALATEHEIDMALLDLSDVGKIVEEKMDEAEIGIGKRYDVQRRFIGQVVREFCNVEWVRGRRYDGATNTSEQTFCFLGRKSDTELAKWLYAYLMQEYARRWSQEKRLHDLPGSHRNTFYLGLRDGQMEKMRTDRAAAQNAALAARVLAPASAATPLTVTGMTQKLELARIDEKDLRKQFTKQKYPSLSYSHARSITLRSRDTYSSGTAHGRSMSMARPLR